MLNTLSYYQSGSDVTIVYSTVDDPTKDHQVSIIDPAFDLFDSKEWNISTVTSLSICCDYDHMILPDDFVSRVPKLEYLDLMHVDVKGDNSILDILKGCTATEIRLCGYKLSTVDIRDLVTIKDEYTSFKLNLSYCDIDDVVGIPDSTKLRLFLHLHFCNINRNATLLKDFISIQNAYNVYNIDSCKVVE